ncbi:chemotaxis protein CheD [Rugamonas apoptosis]|uniref:Probable chemoreceptor glutamine deamidase CheD n=1 Tax=Rugamonas apoptosis TaxID=2758570 RepID=A0A7W2ILH6_9BURK|nr:chemotaxis protein CheD [Rugamonas apoptosis]MBA5688638.1 chemotaxis protein CheD [Rugamonas apoptosis]
MQRAQQVTDIFLLPGQYFVGGEGHRVRTVLGSCVSITLWHAPRRIGAMSHFVLPASERAAGGQPNPHYGADALELMLRDLAALGVAPSECQAKVFGGASMFAHRLRGNSQDIGRRNGAQALRLLRERGIVIASESLYGSGHRRIVFSMASGDVWSHQVAPGDACATAWQRRPPR